jgi:hypothetical protein
MNDNCVALHYAKNRHNEDVVVVLFADGTIEHIGPYSLFSVCPHDLPPNEKDYLDKKYFKYIQSATNSPEKGKGGKQFYSFSTENGASTHCRINEAPELTREEIWKP